MVSPRSVGLIYRLMVGTGNLPVVFFKKTAKIIKKGGFWGQHPLTPPLWKIKGKIESHAMLIVNLSEKKFGVVLSGDNSLRIHFGASCRLPYYTKCSKWGFKIFSLKIGLTIRNRLLRCFRYEFLAHKGDHTLEYVLPFNYIHIVSVCVQTHRRCSFICTFNRRDQTVWRLSLPPTLAPQHRHTRNYLRYINTSIQH